MVVVAKKIINIFKRDKDVLWLSAFPSDYVDGLIILIFWLVSRFCSVFFCVNVHCMCFVWYFDVHCLQQGNKWFSIGFLIRAWWWCFGIFIHFSRVDGFRWYGCCLFWWILLMSAHCWLCWLARVIVLYWVMYLVDGFLSICQSMILLFHLCLWWCLGWCLDLLYFVVGV